MIRVRQVKVSIEKKQNLKKKIALLLKINESDILEYKIIKESVDARCKNNILLIYEVDVLVKNETNVLKNINSKDIFISPKEDFVFKISGTKEMKKRPVIVGSGPAGLFLAYFLSENGYNPIIVERGEKMEDRVKTVESFFETGILNTNSNVQFGEGGAGTFSDGKLNTMIKDKAFVGKRVFEIFVENGADFEIMYQSKPHIGTDKLRDVIINMRNKIISFGAEFRYNTCLTDIIIKNDKISGIVLNNSEILECENLFLAIGHSSRDTIEMLYNKGVNIISKPFAVGVRMMHPQEMINKWAYGEKMNSYLKNASYKLTYNTKEGRGVYSFCMCPGGYVVNASSELGGLVINGMSNHMRESGTANSAIVVSVTESDFGNHPLDGMNFQRNLEKVCYKQGNGKIPLQLYKDFKNNKVSSVLGKVTPTLKGDYIFKDINEILPKFISASIKEAMPHFDKIIPGYARDDAVICAVESRTSSPVRIKRDEHGETNIKGIYPLGEGAGYAGGITSSAIDGVKTALLFASIYRPFKIEKE